MELVINFSGGKDSSLMLDLLVKRYPHVKKHVILSNTGWEHDDVEDWCRGIVSRYDLPLHVVYPNYNFFEEVRKRGKFPGPATRFCTAHLKRAPIAKWIRNNVHDRLVINCLGLRAEESKSRAKKPVMARDWRLTTKLLNHRRKRTVWTWLPIHSWSTEEVYQYLAENDIPLHPIYSYLPRFSCQVCIFMTKANLAAVAENNPGALQRIADLEHEIGFTMFPDGPILKRAGVIPPAVHQLKLL